MRKLGTRFVAVIGMFVGLFFLYSPAPLLAGFPSGPDAHFGKGGVCQDHVGSLEVLTPQIFTLCRVNSGATKWFAEIIKSTGGSAVCTYGTVNAPILVPSGGTQVIPCGALATGSYRGYIYWWVGSSIMMTVSDQYFKKP